MDSTLISALNALSPADLTYQEWINVGMILKTEGFDWPVWDSWSRSDTRYKPGECERKWETFRGSPSPLTGGTLIRMARERGWTPAEGDACLGWGDEIGCDGAPDGRKKTAAGIDSNGIRSLSRLTPVQELRTYLETLFLPDERVSIVANDVWQGQDGRWNPGRGASDRTAREILASLDRYPDDLGATVGDWKDECGAWIRFNPVDGNGVKNENVTRFDYALVESDSMPVADQEALIRALELPVACLVHSGGKSLHAIVRVDARDYGEYRQRVAFLYDFLARNGMTLDRQNSNPSRLSRMPGVTRNGSRQSLIAVNIGRASWKEWLESVKESSDGLPEPVVLESFRDNFPKIPDELIAGVLRCGHKMLISGPSKAGKSFLLMELAISLAEGRPWLGFDCRKSRVLYVNLEIDPASCIMRFMKIYESLKWERKGMKDITVWNLRGHAVPLDRLVPMLLRRMNGRNFDAVIIDPIYKVITGDENSASDMGYFCNQFDRICAETGCSVIYCHHHSKGAQGQKKAVDRASGSGVFARDPDAQLDIIELEMTEDIINNVRDGNATAWRLEGSLREFESFKPRDFWFDYPLHRLDSIGCLGSCGADGSFEAGRAKNKKVTTPEGRRESIIRAYEICKAFETPVSVAAIAEYLDVTERCVRDRIKENRDLFWSRNGVVGMTEKN